MERSYKEYLTLISRIDAERLSCTRRNFPIDNGEISIYYIKQLVDLDALSDHLIKPLLLRIHETKQQLSTQKIIDEVIYANDIVIDRVGDRIKDYLLNGKIIIITSTDYDYAVINFKKVQQRAIEKPRLTYTLRGPQDSFVENLDTNLSLLRYRIKDPKLKIEFFTLGSRTQTIVAVSYIEDIANETLVNEVKERIQNIEIEGIMDSGEIEPFLMNQRLNLFPQTGILERSDMAAGALMEGKIVIIVDGSPLALVAPRTFFEFFHSCDDLYDNKYLGWFLKLLRLLAGTMSLTLSSLYIAVVSFHHDILPTDYVISIAKMRALVPFSAIIEVLVIEIIIELIREALIRIPQQIGQAVGIVGAIIIGQASVAAGVFSPLLLIIEALALIASFVAPDYTITNPFRVLKFGLLGLSALFGFFGFSLVMVAILTALVSTNSFGIPYFAPFAPFNLRDSINSVFYHKAVSAKRAKFLRTIDSTRGQGRDSE